MICAGGHYADPDNCATCKPCGVGTYSAGGAALSCEVCPVDKTVLEGQGSSEDDCVWGEY